MVQNSFQKKTGKEEKKTKQTDGIKKNSKIIDLSVII